MFCPPLGDIETGAILFGIVIVAVEGGLRIEALQNLDQDDKRPFLCPVERVGGTATTVKPTHITDAYTMLIVTKGMGPGHLQRPAYMDGAIEVD